MNIEIENAALTFSDVIKRLGLHVYDDLQFENHVSDVTKDCHFILGLLFVNRLCETLVMSNFVFLPILVWLNLQQLIDCKKFKIHVVSWCVISERMIL